jgi:beta-lactamase class A
LTKVYAGQEQLARRVRSKPSDILSCVPIAKQHVGGDLSVGELCQSAMTLTDNTSANLLLSRAMMSQ